VPIDSPVRVSRVPPACSSASATPKSATTACGRSPPLQQDVLRLDVAVHDAACVRVVERLGDLAREAHRLVHRERPVPREPRAQRLPIDVRHHVVEPPGRVPRVEQGEHVRVLQRRGERDLAQEALRAERHREVRVEHLDRDGTRVAEVAREVDRGHATARQPPLDRVPVDERQRELRELAVRVVGAAGVPGAAAGVPLERADERRDRRHLEEAVRADPGLGGVEQRLDLRAQRGLPRARLGHERGALRARHVERGLHDRLHRAPLVGRERRTERRVVGRRRACPARASLTARAPGGAIAAPPTTRATRSLARRPGRRPSRRG
jgi:hypothetical protein